MGDDLLTSCIRIVSFLSRHITVYCEHVMGILSQAENCIQYRKAFVKILRYSDQAALRTLGVGMSHQNMNGFRLEWSI